MNDILKILDEIQSNLNLVYKTIGVQNNNNNTEIIKHLKKKNEKIQRNERQKKWYRWRKRAERVGVSVLKSRRPSVLERDMWKKEVIKKEKELKINPNINKAGYNINSDGFIYMIKDTTSEFTKIGFTSQKVEQRLSQLQTSNANKLVIYKSYEGNLLDESEIHYYLQKKLRLPHRGEWFYLNDNAIKYIENYFNKQL